MKKFLYLLICLFAFFTTEFTLAQQFTIEGEVNFAIIPLPVPGQTIEITSEDGKYHQSVRTNFDGSFSASFDIAIDTGIVFLVQTNDPCSGNLLSQRLRSIHGSTFIQFLVCQLNQFECQARFTYFPLEDLQVQFLDLSVHPVEKWNWDFGDGKTSDQASPAHQYDSAGSYRVQLIVSGGDSCQDTMSQTIQVDLIPCFCPEYYAPVCVEDSLGQRDTFPNPCFAQCAGYEFFISCNDSCDCPDTLDPVCIWTIEGDLTYKNLCEALCDGMDPTFICDTSCFCPEIYDPVCVVTAMGDTLSFTNDCFAQCAGYSDFFPCPDECPCDRTYAPVCIYQPDGQVITFNNACLAECAGYFNYVVCDGTCDCDSLFDPICIVTTDGDLLRFANLCEAECNGYPEALPCDSCICPLYFAPVCVLNEEGDTLQFDNPCLAECAGYDQYVVCNTPCDCDGIFDPVCVILDNGAVQEYSSACAAICDGFNVFYNCASLCDCSAEIDPVCVTLPDGTSQQFLNSCYADCSGYSNFEVCDQIGGGSPYDEISTSIKSHKVIAFPNPFVSRFELLGSKAGEQTALVQIFDLVGRVIYQQPLSTQKVRWRLSINPADWPSGTYFASIQTGDQVETLKLLKH